MSRPAGRVWRLLAKDLRRGRRSPLVLWALVAPIALTVLLDSVSGLTDPLPRLGVVADAETTSWAEGIEGIATTRVASEASLQQLLLDGRLDAGVVTSADFEQAVRAGEQPRLNLQISGASSPANRGIITSGLLGAVRQMSSATPAVDIVVVRLGEGVPGLGARALPLLVVLALAIAGVVVPGASLAEEKQHRTLQALLVTPAWPGEVLLAKGVAGWILAVVAGALTLAVNGALGAQPAAALLAVVIGAVMAAEIGLLLGAWAPATRASFAAWASGALLLVLYPVVFFIWPSLPVGMARAGPTFYVARPIYEVAHEQAGLDAVAADLAIAALICAALVPVVIAVGRRLARRTGQGKVTVAPA